MRQLAIVTGTTHGIGKVTAHALAKAGRVVVMLCRDLAAAEAVQAEIVRGCASAEVHVVHCDLASLSSVRDAAAAVQAHFGSIDLLINNAGQVNSRRVMTVDGFEQTFAVNHLGPFLLTALLLPQMAAHSRIVNVASRAHWRGTLDFNTVTNEQAKWRPIAAYAQSKLANILFTFALARRLQGGTVTVNCLHPGVIDSNLLPPWLRTIKPFISNVIDVEQGARTSIWLALSDAVSGVSGRYFDEHQRDAPVSSAASSVHLQEALWATSAAWVGLPHA